MPDQEAHTNYSSPSHDVDASIAGKSLLFYWRSGWFFVILVTAVKFIGIVLALNQYVRWGLMAGVFILYAWWLVRRFHTGVWTSVAAGIIIGVLAGLIITVFELIWYHEWWYIMNFIRQPVLLGVLGGGVAGALTIVMKVVMDKQSSKGGGIYGRTETR
ncbi:MAG: hypothetical protein WCT27_03575 [Patescibacteria group bacterium]